MTDKLPLVKANPPIKKFSVEQNKIMHAKGNVKNQFASLKNLDNLRRNNSNSSPSDPAS